MIRYNEFIKYLLKDFTKRCLLNLDIIRMEIIMKRTEKYTIGMDYGTLSGRGVLVRCSDGRIMSTGVKAYTHDLIKDYLPDEDKKIPLPPEWCLQHPQDYLEVLEEVIVQLLKIGQINKEDIIGIGIDFTACTILPIDRDGIPLCMKGEFKNRRNAYVKLWKHHGAQKQADKINALLEKWKIQDTPRFGGKISPELMVPKVLELLEEDPEIYDAASQILEAGDWITRVLTGSLQRSCSMAGYKMWWNHDEGYPDYEFFKSLNPKMEYFTDEKLPGSICRMGDRIGILNQEWSERLGLQEGIAVAPAIIDSHAGFPGSGITGCGQMMMVLGTSGVMLTLSDKPYSAKGICGGVRDGIVRNYYALESGLAAVGDLLSWFVEYFVPMSYYKEAEIHNMNIHTLLSRKASMIGIGESGLLSLDWWNGNKTPFVDANLMGTIIGMTLNTRPEEIYRSLIEATAFGTRMIKELFEENGKRIREVIASGGIASKNSVIMQIYADVLGVDIKIAACDQAAALGSSIYAALAAGAENGGYDEYKEAVEGMTFMTDDEYTFHTKNKEKYDRLYQIYKRYSDTMGSKDREILQALYRLKITKGEGVKPG